MQRIASSVVQDAESTRSPAPARALDAGVPVEDGSARAARAPDDNGTADAPDAPRAAGGRPALRWRALSLLLRTLGQASEGIRLGYRNGFDSGPMLDYVYGDQAHGRWLYGRLADRLYLDSIGWRAIRARKTLLQATLRQAIAANRAAGRPTVLLDVAAGPGRYLQELAAELAAPQSLPVGTAASGEPTTGPAAPRDLTIICRDLDAAGLAQGRARAAARGLSNVRYERGDACDPASLVAVKPQPNLVVASGLYELLDTKAMQRSLAGVYALLPPGGRFIFTTQVRHPQLELIANVLPNRFGEPWVMECRSLAEVEDYARAAGFRRLASELEPLGLFGVTVGEK